MRTAVLALLPALACVLAAPVGAQPIPASPHGIVLHAHDQHFAPGLVEGDQIDVEASSLILFGMIGTWSGRPVADTNIGGIPCAAAEVVRFEMGRLTRCALSAPVPTPFGTLPEGTFIEMNDGTSILVTDPLSDAVQLAFFAAVLGADTVWDGVDYAAGTELIFRPDGGVWAQYVLPLTAPVDDDVPCRFGAPDDRALLHPDGALAACATTASFTIHDVTVPANSIVWFDDVGALSRVELREDWLLGEAIFSAGGHVDFEGGAPVIVGGRVEMEDPLGTQRQSWRVTDGLFYGYDWTRGDLP